MPVVLTDFLYLSAFGFITAVLAVMYYRFVQPGEVLGWWGKLIANTHSWLIKLSFKLRKQPFDVLIYHELLAKTMWVTKPILTCETCIAGQVSLWLFLWFMPYDLLSLLYVIGISTLMAPMLLKWLNA